MINELYAVFKKHPIISIDSRNTIKDSLFFSIRGEKFNGNEFALKAIDEGCSFAIVDDSKLKGKTNCIYVPNALKALQELAKLHRSILDIPIIGITGTNGKTTTKELTASILSTRLKTKYTKGNFNNHIGLPLTILSINTSDEIAIVEMGANHIGEIKMLCSIAQPTHGIITNIGKAHLEGFGSYEGVIQAKTELYQYLSNNNESIAFVNRNNSQLMECSSTLNTFTYGFQDADCIFSNSISEPFVELRWEDMQLKSKLIGTYNTENIMAAVCIGHYFKVDPFKISRAIFEYTPKNKRSEIIITSLNQIILDAYNANPSSMNQSITNFKKMGKKHPFLILGDMFELGKYSKDEHRKIIQLVQKFNFKNVIFVGQDFQKLKTEDYIFLPKTDDAVRYLKDHKLKNKNILIKGSRGMQLEILIPYL